MLKHQNRRVHGSVEEDHPQVQTEASDTSLNRHVTNPRKRSPVKVPNLLLFSNAVGFAGGALGSTVSVCGKYSWEIVSRSFLELLGSAVHSEVSCMFLHSVRARHDRSDIDDLSNIT